ncbi:MAG: site-2 protease family protein [Chloroflexi bacterium]|nr:site-2 protease family protein [Chloroflexota bacterium]
MLLRGIDQLISDPVAFLIQLLALLAALLVGITVHEFSHALAARSLGDSTAERLGRLSLNPKAHLDPLGSIMLLVAGFGWGKPVPVDPSRLRGGRQGMAIVSLAGPVSNVVTAALLAIPFKAGLLAQSTGGPGGELAAFLLLVVVINLVLAAFNLIPLSPLDGFKVAVGLLPRDMARALARIEPYGPIVLLLVIMVDILAGYGILWRIIGPVVNSLARVLLGQGVL